MVRRRRVGRCAEPACPVRSWTEARELAGPRAALTRRAIVWATDALAADDTTVSALARRLGVFVGMRPVVGGRAALTYRRTMDTGRRGLAYGFAAYLLWGLFPLYWPLLEPAGALEILSHRILWSAVVVAGLLAARGRLRGLPRLPPGAALRLTLAGGIIAVNWGAYIWGVINSHVVETSLGYFINPLVLVAFGVVLLHERLRRLQWFAIGLGTLAVIVLTVDYGRPPWLALLLAGSFGTYGYLKNRVAVGAAEGLLVESGVLAVPALAVLAVLGVHGSLTWSGHGADHDLLLMSAGLVTAVPLLFFAGAARRLPLSTVGLLQYVAPVLQFVTGVLVRHEPMPAGRLAGFALVWVALVILTVDGLHHRSRNGRAEVAATPEPLVLSQPVR